MKTIKGPGLFLAQFMGDQPPFNSLKSICQWAKSLGFVGVQIPTWDSRCIDLQKAAESKTYADEVKGIVKECGLEITELSTHSPITRLSATGKSGAESMMTNSASTRRSPINCDSAPLDR